MFEDLKAQLTAIEGKLTAALAALQAQIATLEGEIQTIDAPVATAFDRFSQSVAQVQGTIDQRIAGIHQSIAKLRP